MSYELVRAIKAELVARGVDLNGPCGAWQITMRVAYVLWRDGDPNVGLVKKRKPQNGCYPDGSDTGYGVDVIMWRNGTYRDILIDGGGRSEPTWPDPKPIDEDLWLAPIVPDDMPLPPPPPVPVPPDLRLILDRLNWLEQYALALEARVVALETRPLPPYIGQGRVGWFGGSFTVRSKPEGT